LNDPEFYDQLIHSKQPGSVLSPTDFSPSRLALIALGQSGCESIDPKNLFNSIDPQIFQTALRSFSDQTILKTNPQDLASAGMIALATAYKYCSANSWDELLTSLAFQTIKSG
jgi:hypothetical protein